MRRHSKDVLPGGAGPTTRRELSVFDHGRLAASHRRTSHRHDLLDERLRSHSLPRKDGGLEGRAECREH